MCLKAVVSRMTVLDIWDRAYIGSKTQKLKPHIVTNSFEDFLHVYCSVDLSDLL